MDGTSITNSLLVRNHLAKAKKIDLFAYIVWNFLIKIKLLKLYILMRKISKDKRKNNITFNKSMK